MDEPRDGEKLTSGGSSDSDENDWQVKPIGPSGPCAVTTTTPEANAPSVSRIASGVTGPGTDDVWVVDPGMPRP
ncbi:hypothetical protein GCM10009613_12490 [Pseudonocardia kongjuensis]|uniref:Uncharacterized protein n=1 Tax=Pseudonocardia kongjuensis TaxID=102227 RepID=A0ABN1XJK8_9PSEU